MTPDQVIFVLFFPMYTYIVLLLAFAGILAVTDRDMDSANRVIWAAVGSVIVTVLVMGYILFEFWSGGW